MSDLLKKISVMIASFMVLSLSFTASCLSLENPMGEYRKDVGLTSEMYFNTKFSEYVSGKATIVNAGHSYEDESYSDINDWTTDNYTNKSAVSLNNFYVEFGKENLSKTMKRISRLKSILGAFFGAMITFITMRGN